MSHFPHYDYLSGTGSFSTDKTVVLPHPSTLPQNLNGTALYDAFFRKLVPQVSALFDVGAPPYLSPGCGFEKAWMILLGINIEGTFYFTCHIAEDFVTAKAYNCCDPAPQACPTLLFGTPFKINSQVMSKIRAAFPAHHKGNLPFQAALAITTRTAPNPNQLSLAQLFEGVQGFLETADFTLSLLPPAGTQSLSFKKDHFPIELWTHIPRIPVIHTALKLEIKKLESPLDPVTRAKTEETVKIYDTVCKLEIAISEAIAKLKELEKKQLSIDANLKKEKDSKEKLEKNGQIPPRKKQLVIDRMTQLIGDLLTSYDRISLEIVQKKTELSNLTANLEKFKSDHFHQLPHSYRESTFQIAFETTLPSGQTIYKQYDETGHFNVETNPNKDDPTHLRFKNAVHLPLTK